MCHVIYCDSLQCVFGLFLIFLAIFWPSKRFFRKTVLSGTLLLTLKYSMDRPFNLILVTWPISDHAWHARDLTTRKWPMKKNEECGRAGFEWSRKWTVPISSKRQWFGPKWMILDDSRSESRRSRVKKWTVIKVANWTDHRNESGRSRSMKMDCPKVWNWQFKTTDLILQKRQKMFGFQNFTWIHLNPQLNR